MVSTDEIARGAMLYDTVVALAFRRALGLTGRPTPKGRAKGARRHRYGGMGECFRNAPTQGSICAKL